MYVSQRPRPLPEPVLSRAVTAFIAVAIFLSERLTIVRSQYKIVLYVFDNMVLGKEKMNHYCLFSQPDVHISFYLMVMIV